MGLTAMIPDMTIGQLTFEAAERWGEIWDPMATRTCVLLMCPRRERKLMELHGDMVEHGQPVMSVFHRPRHEAELLEEQAFNPRDASFQFVDIATADLGPWMQHLVTGEGWKRSAVEIASTPFSVGLPTQRPFETIRTLCFRHPSLPPLERYFLPFPPDALPGKCFVSLPRRAAAEMARQQAEVLGIGRLEKPKAPEPPAPPAPQVLEETGSAPPEAEAPPESPAADAAQATSEPAAVPLPPIVEPAEPVAEEAQVPLPPAGADDAAPMNEASEPEDVPTEAPTEPPTEEVVPLPEVEPEPEGEPMSDAEAELRAFFAELMAAGVEPSAFMDDPRWEDINERSLAAGVEPWPILMEVASVG